MNRPLKNITILIILVILVSCYPKKNKPVLPETVVNLSDFNSEFDDYNSTAPSIGRFIPFCFSTNRNSQGKKYDIIYQPMNIHFHYSSGVLTISNDYGPWNVNKNNYEKINTGLNKISTAGNEFGPNLISMNSYYEDKFTLLYSSDITGNFEINYISNHNDGEFSDPIEVEFLNSEYDDIYPTFNSDNSRIYFCSNRENENFNIYYVNVNPDIDINQLLSDTCDYEVLTDSILITAFEDKCPFIYNNKMVFTSNREGGFGGFDLYYSKFENGNWSEPINMGENINTEFDEYRPILIDEGLNMTQTMLVFSSNRPGGKGGFDLYFVGVND